MRSLTRWPRAHQCWHVRIQPRNDLDHVEALGLAIGGELLELVRPMEPLAQPHPPGIAQPEERRAIEVLEMPLVHRDANRPVNVERVFSRVFLNVHRAGKAVQSLVAGLGTNAVPAVRARERRGVANLP